MKTLLGLVLPALGLAGCTVIGTFDTFAGVEPGGKRIVANEAYASHARQRLDVYSPATMPEKAPVVVFFYGGSWRSGRKEDYSFVGRSLAARGFVVVIPDYRLVPEVRFPAFVEDGALALAHVLENAERYGADRRRLYVVGHSAGAYNALMLAVTPQYLARAGIKRSAIRAVAGISGPYDFLPFDSAIAREAFGLWPAPKATQPVAVADGKGPPLLLLHGEGDKVVLPRNTKALARRWAERGGAVEVRYYPNVGHASIMAAFSTTFRNKASTLEDLVAFFNRHAEPRRVAQ